MKKYLSFALLIALSIQPTPMRAGKSGGDDILQDDYDTECKRKLTNNIKDEFKEDADFNQSIFSYNFEYVNQAYAIIETTEFLPEDVRSFFRIHARDYDRTQFLRYASDLNLRNEFISNITPSFEEWTEPFHPDMKEALRKWPQDMKDRHQKQQTEEYKNIYEKFFDNINDTIAQRGPRDIQSFESFFLHLIGIGEVYTGEQHKYKYNFEDVGALLTELKKVGFLQEDSPVDPSFIREIYSPAQKLDSFFKGTSKEDITNLVIAGGHVGLPAMSSISRYKNSLTIDLCFYEVPDVISDINDKELLETLVNYYEGHFLNIYETSNYGDINKILEPETIKYLVRLLKLGGRLMCGSSTTSDINEETAKALAKEHNLKMIYKNDNALESPIVIALEKKEPKE